MKLYLTTAEAAEWSGIGEKAIRDMLNSIDPPPFIRIGSIRKIQAAKFPEYLEKKQEVRL